MSDDDTSEVCVWADGPTRDRSDLTGLRTDIAQALGAPVDAVELVSSETRADGVALTVTILAPHVFAPCAPFSRDAAW